jgi:hypothetical protein
MKNVSKTLALLICLMASMSAWGQTDPTLGTDADWNKGWTAIDANVVYVSPGRDTVRAGASQVGYFEADFHKSYINNVTFVFKQLLYDPTYQYKLYYWIDDDPDPESVPSSAKTLVDGTSITLTDVSKFLHMWCSYHLNNYLNIALFTWTNITNSTSENYKNYLNNSGASSTTSMTEMGDGTYLLSPTWTNATETITINDNWTGKEGKVYAVTGGTTISQTVSNLPSETYTVQAIVRGAEGKNITLSLNGNDTTKTLYGTAANSTSTVNNYGRVELVEKGTNNGWIKIEGTAEVTNGSLTISLASDRDYQVSDVTLLYKANQEGYYWTTLDNMDSYVDMSDTVEQKSYYVELYRKTYYYTYPQYNKFSFFDRGLNKNKVIYAHPLTVIGLASGVADDNDHTHPCNVVVRGYEYQPTTEKVTNSSTGASITFNYDKLTLLDTYTCPLLSLVDTDGSPWENKHTFGIPTNFTASAVKYTRNYNEGQSITAVFPFELTSDELSSYYGTSTVYKLSSVSNTAANFTSASSTSANEPFMVKTPTISGEQTLNLTNKTVEATTNGATLTADGGSMVGVYEQTAWSADNVTSLAAENKTIYMFNAQSSTGQYGKLSSRGGDIRPFRSYLQVTGTASPAKLNVIFDDVADGIEGIVSSEGSTVSDVYTLAGIKVGTSAYINKLPKGVYIVNGKKVIVK